MSDWFYAALINDSYHVPGDERSRTNPGHGYPAHDVSFVSFVEFTDEHAMMDWVKKNDSASLPKKYKLVKCYHIAVTKAVTFEVSE